MLLNRFIALLVLLGLLSGCSDEAALKPLFRGDVVLAFGDSLTAGHGTLPQYSYPVVLQQLTGLDVTGAGIVGETSAEGLQRLPGLLEQLQPKLVILMEGGNDILRNLPASQTRDNLAQMIEMVQARGAELILIGIPEKKLLSDSAPFYRQLAEQYQVLLMDDLVSDMLKDSDLKSDMVHFNRDGYYQLAEAIAELLREEGALP